jgi:hypothetical protein
MPNDRPDTTHHPQDDELGMSTNVILLTLPWLSFVKETLGIIKEGLQNKEHKKGTEEFNLVKPIERLVASELHALFMVLDRSRTLRGLIGEDHEHKLVEEFTQVSKKLVSGSVHLMEAQEIVLGRIVDALKNAKNGQHKKSQQAQDKSHLDK